MTIRSSLYFIFDGVTSQSMGITNINISSGMLDEPFLTTRHINEVKIRGRDKPYFSGITNDALTFTLSFAFNKGWTNDDIRAVSRWLSTEYYKPLIFSDNLERIYYAMLDGDSKLIHNGASQGYITLTMRCDSAYSYSPYETKVYDLSNNSVGGTAITFENFGDIEVQPQIYITMVGSGNMSIVNNTNGGQTFAFTGLLDAESLYVDNENEVILSDLIPTTYRYGNFNNGFLTCVYGYNYLQIYGKCKIQFKYQYKLLQG